MRRAAVALLLIGCAESGTPVEAAVGATLTSDDGVLTLVIPPGALPRDASIAIETVEESDWPVQAPGRFERPAPVYRIEPMGLELVADAYVVFTPTRPELLASGGADVLAVHYSWGSTDEKVRPADRSRTVFGADGSVAVIATVFELGVHWIGERVPGADRDLPQLSVTPRGDLSGDHAVGEPFSLEGLALESDLDHALFSRSAFAAARGSVRPVAWDVAPRPWNDAHLLPLPDSLLDGPERDDQVAEHDDPAPVTLGPGAPLEPLVAPLPGWTCETTGGLDSVLVGVDVVTGASSGVARVGYARELPVGSCQ